MALNLAGITLTIFNIWTYPRRYTGAFVLGNLLVAILMRNELFGRFLYLLVNTLFSKVNILYLPLILNLHRHSGLLFHFDWDVLRFSNILAVYIQDARHLDSFG